MPDGYYALAEQVAGDIGPDVLTLEAAPDSFSPTGSAGSALLEVDAPPAVRYTLEAEAGIYARKADHLAIHHSSDDRAIKQRIEAYLRGGSG